jgi:hypothetical protein
MFADIIVDDREERPFMLVDVKPTVASRESLAEFVRRLEHSSVWISFGLVVDLEDIRLLKRRQGAFTPEVNLKTKEILSRYDPDFAGRISRHGSIQIFQDYVQALVEGWLRDLAYHWNSKVPPGTDTLSETGLLEQISGGFTRSGEVASGGYSLSQPGQRENRIEATG